MRRVDLPHGKVLIHNGARIRADGNRERIIMRDVRAGYLTYRDRWQVLNAWVWSSRRAKENCKLVPAYNVTLRRPRLFLSQFKADRQEILRPGHTCRLLQIGSDVTDLTGPNIFGRHIPALNRLSVLLEPPHPANKA